jgi:hypothetical protein
MSRFAIVAPLAAALLSATPGLAVTALQGVAPEEAFVADHAPGTQQSTAATSLADLRSPAESRSALPEPATWFTLVAGFALVGFAVRWRRTPPAQPSPWPDAR